MNTKSLMYKTILIFLLNLILASQSNAQSQITWTQNNVTSATQAQGFEYRFYLTPPGSTVTTPVILTSVLCGGTAPNVNCSTVLPASLNAARVTGAKSELSAKDGISAESVKSLPFFMGAAAPINLLITP